MRMIFFFCKSKQILLFDAEQIHIEKKTNQKYLKFKPHFMLPWVARTISTVIFVWFIKIRISTSNSLIIISRLRYAHVKVIRNLLNLIGLCEVKIEIDFFTLEITKIFQFNVKINFSYFFICF